MGKESYCKGLRWEHLGGEGKRSVEEGGVAEWSWVALHSLWAEGTWHAIWEAVWFLFFLDILEHDSNHLIIQKKYFVCLQSCGVLPKKKNREVVVEPTDRKRLGSIVFLKENGVENE